MEECKSYTVYIHHFPNGKVYVGLTKQLPETRWRNDGTGYNGQRYMRHAINKYGWENIQHEIFAYNLTQQEASEIEQRLINYYNSNNEKFGYNIQLGGLNSSKIVSCDSEIMELWNDGYGISAIAKKLNHGWRIVRECLVRHGITEAQLRQRVTITRSNAQNNLHKDDNAKLDKTVLELWNKDYLEKEIADELSIPRWIIQRSLDRLGITIEERQKRKLDGLRSFKVLRKGQKVVKQYTLDGNYVATYKSAYAAGQMLNYSSQNIWKACKEHRAHKGFLWEYSEYTEGKGDTVENTCRLRT